VGRLRMLIDRLNSFEIPDTVSIEPAPHVIVEQELSPQAEAAELDEEPDDGALPRSA
jgi:hypothetical protein